MAKVHRDAKQAGVENLLAANPEQKEQMVRNLQGQYQGSGVEEYPGSLNSQTKGQVKMVVPLAQPALDPSYQDQFCTSLLDCTGR